MLYLLDLHAITSDIQDLLIPVAGSHGVTLAVYDRTGRLVVAAGEQKQAVPAVQQLGTPVAQVLRSGLNLVVDRVHGHQLCRSCPLAAACSLAVEILTPLVAEHECIGVVAIMAWEPEVGKELGERRAIFLQLLRQISHGIVVRLRCHTLPGQVRRLESYVQFLVDSSRDATLVVDANQRIVAANDTAAVLLGSPADGLRVRPIAEVAPGEILDAATRGRAIRNVQHGGLVWDARPVREADELHGMVVGIRPVTGTVPKRAPAGRRFGLEEIRGAGEAIAAVKNKVRRIAPTESTVLIRGESGTGKELFARALHWESSRRGGPFVAVNCAAIPEQLLESELFGYDDGAFTGARKGGKPGKFELANGGTLLLDEVGDLPLHLQAKLLRVLQFKEVERVGGTDPSPVDFRLIAATNRPLEEMIPAGTFREDLYYRLNVIPLDIPPLRERKEDLSLLLELFTKRLVYLGRHRPKRWSAEALNALYGYEWPGNVRELENVVEHAVSVEEGELITVGSLPTRMLKALDTMRARPFPQPEIVEVAPLPSLPGGRPEAPEPERLGPTPIPADRPQPSAENQAEAARLRQALDEHGRTTEGKEMAARALGISRATLYRRLKALSVS